MMEQKSPARTMVALWKGEDRAENLRNVLKYIIEKIDWSSRRLVLIKPNLVKADCPYAITHPEALKVVLAMIRERYSGQLVVAEGCAEEPTHEFFKMQGFDRLAAEFNARLVDLNADDPVPVTIFNKHEKRVRVSLARTVIESDCRISLSIPKTHNVVPVTLTIKNMVMGSLLNRRLVDYNGKHPLVDRIGRVVFGAGNGWGSDKNAMHQGYPIFNINLARLAPLVFPHLSILDGYISMEGEGPLRGAPVPWRIAMAGIDPLAVDVFASHLMGFELPKIGYLSYCSLLGLGCSELERLDVVGNVLPQQVTREFTPHSDYPAQIHWQHPDPEPFLVTK